MKYARSVFIAAMALCAGTAIFAQNRFEVLDRSVIRVIPDHQARAIVQAHEKAGNAARAFFNTAGLALPSWTYNFTGPQSGGPWSGLILGADPTSNQTATIPVVVIPVIINITQGSTTYSFDPTAPDGGCLGGGNAALPLTVNSPLFQSANFTFPGLNVNNTQYTDAFLRDEFATFTAPSNPHLWLNATTAAPLTITANAGGGRNGSAAIYSAGNQCGSNTNGVNPSGLLAVVDINSVDALLQSYIASTGITSSQFALFVTYNAVLSQGSARNQNNCCILGYHTATNSGQTYGFGEFEGRDQTVFTGIADIAAISHELNEWVNDPLGSNITPPWGNVGQETGCQNDLEVGDPLSGTLMPPISLNGFTYHVQELAFFSWFFGEPLFGAGGVYSSNGTFTAPARPCPPGGTN